MSGMLVIACFCAGVSISSITRGAPLEGGVWLCAALLAAILNKLGVQG